MEFGLFTEFQCPAGRTESAAFDESIAQSIEAERLGFDAVWLAELHFQKDRSVLSSPLVIAAALATATSRVKIGIAVQVPRDTAQRRFARPSLRVHQRVRILEGILGSS